MPNPPVPPDEFLRALTEFSKAEASGNLEQQEAAAADIFAEAARFAEANPDPGLQRSLAAGECEAVGDWAGAESHYRAMLAEAEVEAEADAAPGAKQALAARAHDRLGRLLRLLGRRPEAGEHVRQATERAARSGMTVLHAAALVQEAGFVVAEVPARALTLTEALVALLATDQELESRLLGRALTLRAHARLRCGDVPAANADLAAARPRVVDRPISPMFAGQQQAAAQWWDVCAELRAREGDLAEAVAARERALAHWRDIAALPHAAGPYALAAMARASREYAAALRAHGDEAAAERAAAEARAIQAELGLPETAAGGNQAE